MSLKGKYGVYIGITEDNRLYGASTQKLTEFSPIVDWSYAASFLHGVYTTKEKVWWVGWIANDSDDISDIRKIVRVLTKKIEKGNLKHGEISISHQ